LSTKQKKLSDFLEGVAEQEKIEREETNVHGSGTYEDRERLVVPFDEVYEYWYLEGYTDEIKGTYGVSTAVRVTSPEGVKHTLWLGSHEQTHFLRKLSTWTLPLNPGRDEKGLDLPKGRGLSYPFKITFCRQKELSEKSGYEFNKFVMRLDAYGDDVEFELEALQ